MTKLSFLAPLAMAATLSLAAAPAFAETVRTQPTLCAQSPETAAKAGIDCTTTSTIVRDQDKPETDYPSGPVNFGNGIVF